MSSLQPARRSVEAAEVVEAVERRAVVAVRRPVVRRKHAVVAMFGLQRFVVALFIMIPIRAVDALDQYYRFRLSTR